MDQPPDSRPLRRFSTRIAAAAAAATIVSQNPSSSSKIAFASRKIRKISKIPTSDSPQSLAADVNAAAADCLSTNPKQWLPVFPKIERPLSSDGELDLAIQHLRCSDPLLRNLIDNHQSPAFDSSHPPFLALAKSILYQQLAVKAAKSIYTRFITLCGGEDRVSPDIVLELSAIRLREIGVSGRKASYLHDLASKYQTRVLSDSLILEMDDESLLTMLTLVKGIGIWSVHMFMIFSLHRPDVLPVGDLGVRKGVKLLYGLKELPGPLEMEKLCEKWKPFRSVGSWYMWRFMEAKGAPATAAAVDKHLQQNLDPQNGNSDLG